MNRRQTVRIFNIVCFICAVILFINVKPFFTMKQEIDNLEKQNFVLQLEGESHKGLLEDIFKEEVSELKEIEVTLSAYNAVLAQCDTTPWLDSNGKVVLTGSVAISRDLEKSIPLNSFIWIPGQGVFKVTGRMNAKYRKTIDILAGNLKAGKLFGRQKNIKIYHF